MALRADDDMVVKRDAEPFACFRNVPGDGAVLPGRCRVAARMVVDHPTAFIIILIFNDFFEEPLKVVPGFGSCT